MGRMRSFGFGLLAAGVAAGVVVIPAAAAAKDKRATYLFVINSKRGTITGIGKDTGEEKLTLALRGVNDHATQFADRPIRKAYVLSTRDLAARWQRWFAGDPPNAVLTFSHRRDLMPHSIVVKLTHPRYQAKAGTLTFTARHIHRATDLSPDAKERIALPHRRPPATFIRGSLFIDSVAEGTVINGCAIGPYADCEGVDLSGQDLSGANLFRGLLPRANFARANLSGAKLPYANLSGANLSQANLIDAQLPYANLSGANLSWAFMLGTSLTKANLSGATWTDGRKCGVDPGPVYTGKCL